MNNALATIPKFDDDNILDQWRDANRAGEGRAFGDPNDLICEADIYEAAEIEGARVVCTLDTPDCYLVAWSDDYYVVCDANGWWACRVSLSEPEPTDGHTNNATIPNLDDNNILDQWPVAEPADMDLVEAAFDQHWRHDGGECMIELSAFKAHQPRDLDAYTVNGSLYYSNGSLAWSIALEYLD